MRALITIIILLYNLSFINSKGVIQFNINGKEGVIFHETYPLNKIGFQIWNPTLKEVLRFDSLVFKKHSKELGGHREEKFLNNSPVIANSEFNDVAKTPLDEWIYYHKNEELPKDFRAKGLSLVAENLIINKMNVKELKTYQKYKDKIVLSESVYETAYTEGVIKGKDEGKIEGKIESVIGAFHEGLSIELISRIVKIPEDKVYNILRNHGLI